MPIVKEHWRRIKKRFGRIKHVRVRFHRRRRPTMKNYIMKQGTEFAVDKAQEGLVKGGCISQGIEPESADRLAKGSVRFRKCIQR